MKFTRLNTAKYVYLIGEYLIYYLELTKKICSITMTFINKGSAVDITLCENYLISALYTYIIEKEGESLWMRWQKS